MTVILEARHVNKSHTVHQHEEHQILKDINLQVRQGEFVTIIFGFWQIYTTIQYQRYGSG